MTKVRYPMLYQINTRVRLTELECNLGRTATLDDISDSELDQLAATGSDWIWLLGIWQTGPAGRLISLTHPDLQREYHETLPDFEESDVAGSCFAVRSYTAHSDFGGDEALARLRNRLHRRGLRLMLDFVPNHTAPDHRWVEQHPDYYVHGSEDQLEMAPHNYTRVMTRSGPLVLAYGRDPYIPGWSDTLQLNYGNPALQDAMIGELEEVASRCDGVRCDMAMLVLPQIFERTWGVDAGPFWPRATDQIRDQHPEFLFMAEAYWDLEWTLQQQGFDYAYDKRLYDRLRDARARPVRDHFRADLSFQDKLVRFLENHDEPRAAAVFTPEVHRAAAIVTYLSPGMRFFHQGQMEGRKIRIPVQLQRGPAEPDDPEVCDFYKQFIECLRSPVVRDGDWRKLECRPAWDGNWTRDCFIAFAWEHSSGRRIIAVNYADHRSQCYIQILLEDLTQGSWLLRDLMGEACHTRDGAALASPGLYLDLPGWGYHVFEITRNE
jgi:glycosidase